MVARTRRKTANTILHKNPTLKTKNLDATLRVGGNAVLIHSVSTPYV